MENWLLASAFALYIPICMKFMKLCRTDIKILLAFQQDVRTYAGNLIYGVRLQVNVGDKLAKKIFQCVAALFWKKLKKTSFVSDGHFREWNLNFSFFIASLKSNYGEIYFLPNKLKFDDGNICTKLLIREKKIINNFPSDTLISLKSNVWMLKHFALWKYDRRLQIFLWLETIYYIGNVFIYKEMKVPFLSTMLSIS